MFATQQVKEWESKVQATFTEAQKSAHERARRIEAEARKAIELFGDRAQAELKQLKAMAQEGTRESWSRVGAEFIRLGQLIQEMAKAPEAAAPVAVEPVAAAPVAFPAADVAVEAAKAAAAGAPPPAAGIQ
jgi:uncharacterized protein YaaN involved in tellurite resistance